MLSFIKKNDLLILLVMYFFLLPIGKTLWYPLFIMAIVGSVAFIREINETKGLQTGTRWLLAGGACVYLPALASTINTVDLGRTSVFLVSYPLFFLAGYFIYNRLCNGARIGPILWSFAAIVFFWGTLAVWQYLDPSNPFGPGGSHNQGLHSRDNRFVDGGLMLGVILGSVFAFMTFGLWGKGFRKTAVLIGAAIVFLVFISGTRSAWVSVLFTIAATTLYVLARGWRPSLSSAAVLSTIILISVAAVYKLYQLPGLNAKLNQTLIVLSDPTRAGLDRALSGRLDIWEDAIALGLQSPLVGYGVNNYRYAVGELDQPKGVRWITEVNDPDSKHNIQGASHTHQIVMEALSGAGFIGVLGLVIYFIGLTKFTVNAFRAGSLIAMGAILALWAGFLPFNTHNNFYGGWMNAWFWVWMGLSAGLFFRPSNPREITDS